MNQARKNAASKLKKAIQVTEKKFRKPDYIDKNLGIAGNTFRTYSHFGQKPSVIYKDWVKEKGYKVVEESTIANRDDFMLLHKKLVKSFETFCKKSGCRPLLISETNKVIDLYTKALAFNIGHPCEKQRQGLYKYANIPLDKYSLTTIGELFYGIIVCNNPSMGHIRDMETYNFIQSRIFDLTSSIKIPNLVFDTYAWDMNH